MMSDFEKAVSTDEFADADTQPKASAHELKKWWHRNTIAPRFYPYIVKRIGEETTPDGLRYLYFQLARREDLKDPNNPDNAKRFRVELTQQHKICWPDLPSTAQLATEAHPYGFLMLTADWEANANSELSNAFDVTSLRESGEKWPKSARTKDLLRALSEDEALEDMPLLEALNHIMNSLR
ncbi:hypothetical protein D7W81_27670 [Corallococcus aberystwythensis]|uniref:Uncharacterized protein n=2 Tax=Corallococcus aberystwythensis TaxID=2316722 RepID=A0A3A8Q2Y0_9BACT|nr:hypothetical protein D7W81_27670 [Corallococcus aberystwythensis]